MTGIDDISPVYFGCELNVLSAAMSESKRDEGTGKEVDQPRALELSNGEMKSVSWVSTVSAPNCDRSRV